MFGRSRFVPALAVVALLASLLVPTMAAAQSPPAGSVAVIVQKSGSTQAPETLVRALGGSVTRALPIINGFAASMPQAALPRLAGGAGVRLVTPDGPVTRTGAPGAPSGTGPPDYFLDTVSARSVWAMRDARGRAVNGAGVGIAIVDSGVTDDPDFDARLTKAISFNSDSSTHQDVYGHGTHVAGIAAGSGADSYGFYKGVAPGADVISLKICDEAGNASESDAVAALQWVLDNKAAYDIRVVNLSVNAGSPGSYMRSPLDAACEILWFDDVVVVASAGNRVAGGPDTIDAAPANDPFVITVGATDEEQTPSPADDSIASFSAYGKTADGFAKPEIVAPGTGIYSTLSKHSDWGSRYPDRLSFGGQYFRLSGTSMAAPVVAGTAALILQKEPGLNPDQVKYRLTHSALLVKGLSDDGSATTYPYVNANLAATNRTTLAANTGTRVSAMLTTGSDPLSGSVMWNSVMWNSVMWNSVMWNSVMWNSVMWNSVMWSR